MNYNYSRFIESPLELSTVNTLTGEEISDNMKIREYVGALISGDSNALTASPLGNAYFMDTNSQCINTDTGDLENRFVFMSNITYTEVPFPIGFMGFNFNETKGLLPGIIDNINQINDIDLQSSLVGGEIPECRNITMQTVNSNNNVNNESQFVALTDIEEIDPCSFPTGVNPLTNETCVEAFTSLENLENSRKKGKMPADFYSQLYLGSLGFLGIYIVYHLFQKHQNKKK